MIQITRLLAKQIRTIFKNALGFTKSALAPDLRLTTGPDGLKAQAQTFEHAAEYHQPGPLEPAELVVPFAVLDDVQGTRAEPVDFSLPKPDVLAATWEDRGVPRTIEYDRPKPRQGPPSFPAAPAAWTENPPPLLAALCDAFDTTDIESSRYALGCIQLRGQAGEIAATDGHQMLLQSGFYFGFDEELLVRRTSAFKGKVLPTDQVVQAGRTETHVAIRIGGWTFWLAIEKEGRFPRVEHIIPAASSASTTLELVQTDADFMAANISRLHNRADERAVTLDLNGAIAIRAKDMDAARPVEMVLSNSIRMGEDIRINTDHRFLVRAVEMGFRQLKLYGPNGAVLARDDQRNYLWMPLGPDNLILPSDDCLRIESPRAALRSSPTSPVSRSTLPMNRPPLQATASPPPAAESAPQTAPTRCRRASAVTASPLDQAVGLRTSLREAVHRTNELIRSMKKERKHQRLLKSTLKSLKDLQAAAA